MKKQTIILATLFALAGTFASCGQESDNEYVSNAGKDVIFNIGMSETLVRTATVGETTNFVVKDEIGIFGVQRGKTDILDKNVKYTYNSSEKWEASPAIAFPIDQSDVNFYAYYPHVAAVETLTFDFPVAVNQSTGYNTSDLIVAKNESSNAKTDKSIELQFAHVLALMEVTVTMPAGTTLASGKIYAQAIATVNLKDQTATLKADQGIVDIEMCKQDSNEANTFKFRVMLPAQDLMAARLMDFIDNDGLVYSYRLESKTSITAKKLNKIAVTFN